MPVFYIYIWCVSIIFMSGRKTPSVSAARVGFLCGVFINEPLDVDLVAIVKDSQHHDVLPGKGPCVIYSMAAASAEATEAFKSIKMTCHSLSCSKVDLAAFPNKMFPK